MRVAAMERRAVPLRPVTDRPHRPNCARSSYVRFQSPAAVPLAGFRACSRQMVATLRLPFAKSPDVSKMSLWGGWRNGRDLKPFFGERNGKRRYQCKKDYLYGCAACHVSVTGFAAHASKFVSRLQVKLCLSQRPSIACEDLPRLGEGGRWICTSRSFCCLFRCEILSKRASRHNFSSRARPR